MLMHKHMRKKNHMLPHSMMIMALPALSSMKRRKVLMLKK